MWTVAPPIIYFFRCNNCVFLLTLNIKKCVCLLITSPVPVEGKSSVCVICMKYRIIFYYHQPVRLCQIVLSYIANTSRTHARTGARTHTRVHVRAHAPARTPAHPHTHTHDCRCIAIRCQPTVTGRSAANNSRSLAFEINSGTGCQVSPRMWKFSRIKNC